MKKKVLVVEDEPHISKLVTFILEKEGYEVLNAYVGQEGIDIAMKERPNLIVLDVMMPNMDGFEVAEILGEREETKDIPILMLSSATQFRDKMRSVEVGAVDYVTKPFDNDELIQKVEEYIE